MHQKRTNCCATTNGFVRKLAQILSIPKCMFNFVESYAQKKTTWLFIVFFPVPVWVPPPWPLKLATLG